MRAALLLFLVALPCAAAEDGTLTLAGPAIRGYGACMQSHVREYAVQAKSIDDAILATRGACASFRAYMVGRIVEGERLTQGASADAAELTARLAAERVDENLRPELARIALEPAR